MADQAVEKLFADFKALVNYLDEQGQPSFRSFVEDVFRKVLLMAAASYFEDRIVNDLLSYVRGLSDANYLVAEFTQRQALQRKYHTLFDWNVPNANQFFKLFGSHFSEYMAGLIKNDEGLDQAIKAFMEIGGSRNRLVHQNFASFALEKDSEEIFQLYQNGLQFVEALPTKLKECPPPLQVPEQ